MLCEKPALHRCLKPPQSSSISQPAHPGCTDVVRALREKGPPHRRSWGTPNRPETQAEHWPTRPRRHGPLPKVQDSHPQRCLPESHSPGTERHPSQPRERGEETEYQAGREDPGLHHTGLHNVCRLRKREGGSRTHQLCGPLLSSSASA